MLQLEKKKAEDQRAYDKASMSRLQNPGSLLAHLPREPQEAQNDALKAALADAQSALSEVSQANARRARNVYSRQRQNSSATREESRPLPYAAAVATKGPMFEQFMSSVGGLGVPAPKRTQTHARPADTRFKKFAEPPDGI